MYHCGLLSLNSRSCPACGSQNLVDLTENEEDPLMPSEVQGLMMRSSLDELEGVNQNDEMQQTTIQNNPKSSKRALFLRLFWPIKCSLSRLPLV